MVIEIRKQQYRKAVRGASAGASVPYKIIVTGFNSFGKNLENPSGLTAVGLPSELEFDGKSIDIEGMLLETCCKSSWNAVKKTLTTNSRPRSIKSAGEGKQKPRTILILMGLAANREVLNIERLALNIRDYPIRDNHGHQYDGEEIQPGPLAIETDYPLHDLRKKLNSKGFPTVISNHCGTFVCNDIYYQSLTFREKYGSPDLVLFIHLPRAHVFAKSVREKGNKRLTELLGARPRRSTQLAVMQEAIVEVIKFSVGYLERQAVELPRIRRSN